MGTTVSAADSVLNEEILASICKILRLRSLESRGTLASLLDGAATARSGMKLMVSMLLSSNHQDVFLLGARRNPVSVRTC